MKQAYGYIVKNGCYEDNLSGLHPFIVFADEIDIADAFIERYVKKAVEEEKYTNDLGETMNWWWKYYAVEKVPVSKFDSSFANIIWLE